MIVVIMLALKLKKLCVVNIMVWKKGHDDTLETMYRRVNEKVMYNFRERLEAFIYMLLYAKRALVLKAIVQWNLQ